MYCGHALWLLRLDGEDMLRNETNLALAFTGSLEFGVLYVKGRISQMLI